MTGREGPFTCFSKGLHHVSVTNSSTPFHIKYSIVLNVLIREGKERHFHHINFIGRNTEAQTN